MNSTNLQHRLATALSRREIGEATRIARTLVNNYANPPAEALNLVGPRPGWKHISRNAMR
jgi:hypothetical protein